MASVKIHRPDNSIGRLREFKVYLDGKRIGEIPNGATMEYQVCSGTHKIYCKQDFFNTPFKHEFSIRDNETKSLTAAYNIKTRIMLFIGIGLILFAILSSYLIAWLNINPTKGLGFYFLGAFIFLLVMKSFKQFTIFISE